jgi:hypothetical protein
MQIFVKLLSGRMLTLEVEGTMATEELLAMVEREGADGSLVAHEHRLLVGEGEGTRLLKGMVLADYDVKKESELRLVPRQRPPPDASQTQMAEALNEAKAVQTGIAGRWDKHHDSVEALESRKLTAARRYGF